ARRQDQRTGRGPGALLGREGPTRDRPVRLERGSHDRSGWTHNFAGTLARPRRYYQQPYFRRSRREVSDVGPEALRILSSGGAPEGAQSPQTTRRGAPRKRRARGGTGMERGSGGGYRVHR